MLQLRDVLQASCDPFIPLRNSQQFLLLLHTNYNLHCTSP